MAQKRMINQKISLSEKLAVLCSQGALLYTWMIPHADDLSLLPGSPMTIKYKVVPMMKDITEEDVAFQLESMWKLGLIQFVKQGKKQFIYIVGNEKEQILKKDRQPQVILDMDLDKDPKKSWDKAEKLFLEVIGNLVEDNGIQTENNGFQLETEEKGREEKVGEEKSILNTGDKRPEISLNAKGPLADLLKKKIPTIPPPDDKISTSYQEKAFRYAKDLHITLKEADKPRWVRPFKEEALSIRKTKGSTDEAYSFLRDYEGNLTYDEMLNYFFSIYEKGTNFKPLQL